MGAMALCGALCYGELAARVLEAGGGYVYLREAIGPRRVPPRVEVPAGDGPGAHGGARRRRGGLRGPAGNLSPGTQKLVAGAIGACGLPVYALVFRNPKRECL
jgi:amino acid transporter